MTMHNPVHANAKMTVGDGVLALRRRLAKAHRILTAGGNLANHQGPRQRAHSRYRQSTYSRSYPFRGPFIN